MHPIDQAIESELTKWPQRRYRRSVYTLEHLAAWSLKELQAKAVEHGLTGFMNKGALILSLYEVLNPPLPGYGRRRRHRSP